MREDEGDDGSQKMGKVSPIEILRRELSERERERDGESEGKIIAGK